MTNENENIGWEHFPHQADIGVRGFGDTIAQAFEQAAIAMTAVIVDPKRVQPNQKIEINCDADDRESLFVDWLNSLLYEMDTRKMLFSKFKVRIENNHISAEIWGQKIDVPKHQPAVEVKGASYTSLKVKKRSDQTWIAQCVVDV